MIDPLLREMQDSRLGLSINGLPIGASAHADDIRALTNSWDNLDTLIQMVHDYTISNGLKLNMEKCEILTVPRNTANQIHLTQKKIPIKDSISVLGTQLTGNLTSENAVDDNILKSKKAFFALGNTGLFQGKLNPLTSRDLCETCVFPVLLYGCENWILKSQLIGKL